MEGRRAENDPGATPYTPCTPSVCSDTSDTDGMDGLIESSLEPSWEFSSVEQGNDDHRAAVPCSDATASTIPPAAFLGRGKLGVA